MKHSEEQDALKGLDPVSAKKKLSLLMGRAEYVVGIC